MVLVDEGQDLSPIMLDALEHCRKRIVIVGDTQKAQAFSAQLFEEGVFALAIGFPTVPKGKERLRTIVSAGHTEKDLEKALKKFRKVGRRLGII